VWASWCLFPDIWNKVSKRLPAKFVKNLRVYCFQNWKPSPWWVYTTCFPPRCEQVGVFSIHREQSRQQVFLLSLWQNVIVYWFQTWKLSLGWLYTKYFPPRCEQVGVFSILREQSRQKFFLLSLWQNMSVLLSDLKVFARMGAVQGRPNYLVGRNKCRNNPRRWFKCQK
jgi:hypothetical protein